MVQRSLLYSCLFLFSATQTNGFAPISRHDSPRPHSARISRRPFASSSALNEAPLPPVYVLDPSSATPFEFWCVSSLEKWYTQSVAIKCPFFRRRAADLLDALDLMLRFLVIRHKSLDLDILPPLGSRTTKSLCSIKTKNMDLSDIARTIQKDWKVHNDKGYYISGRLTTAIYREDCIFDGPDPDMPVKGLKKYQNAASQLFDQGKSSAELLSLTMQPDENTITARWRMDGVLRLPWKPALPEWTGSTTYFLDEDGLIYEHTEQWDISVLEAFTKTITPWLGAHIWDEHCVEAEV